MEKRTYPNLLFFCFFTLFLFPQINAQVNCVDCPLLFGQNVIGQGLIVSQIEVETDGPNDLAQNNLVEVCVTIEHPGASDIFLVLIAPDGTAYYLLGDDNNNAGGCIGPYPALVDLCFYQGNFNPVTYNSPYLNSCIYNGGCQNDIWNVSCGPSLFSDIFPVATAAPNCDLHDFNTAGSPVEGIWTLVTGCVCMQGEANAMLLNWSLSFEQQSGGTENTCLIQDSEIINTSLEVCQEADYPIIPIQLDYVGFDYPYFLGTNELVVLMEDDLIVKTTYSINVNDFEPGQYQATKLLFKDNNWNVINSIIEQLNGLTKEAATIYLNDQGLCYSWASNQAEVNITATAPQLNETAMACPGECVIINGVEYCEPGEYAVLLEASNQQACDTNLIIDFAYHFDESEVTADIAAMPCLGAQLQLQAEGGLTYEWTGPNGFESTEANPLIDDFSWDMVGTYTVYIGMPGDCETSRVIDIQEICSEESLELEILQSTLVCTDGPLMEWDYCNASGNGTISFQVLPDDCIEITGVSPGLDAICLMVGGQNLTVLHHTVYLKVLEAEYSWPGDLNFDNVANHLDALYLGLAYEAEGTARLNPSTDWAQQYAPSWSNQTPQSQINFKHIDADGNGQINRDDLLPIEQNWQQSHTDGQNPGLPTYNGSNIAPLFLELPEFVANQMVEIPLHLGNADQTATDIYGLAFRIVFDPELVQNDEVQFEFQDNFLGIAQEDWLSFVHYENGILSASLTRLDGQAVNGFGPIGQLRFQVATDYPLAQSFDFELINDLCLNPLETACGLIGGVQSTQLTTGIYAALPADWQLSPNPASDRLYFNTNGKIPDQLYLLDVQSRLHKSWTPDDSRAELDLQDIAPGLYIFVIEDGQKRYHQRLVIVP